MNLKPRNTSLKYEEVVPNTTYAWTFAPTDEHQCWNSPDRYNSFILWMRTYFFKVLKGAYIKVMPELSSLGRLHLHGYITVYNPMDFYLYTIPSLMEDGTFVIKPLTDETVWETYCRKQRLESEYIFVPPVYKPLKNAKKKSKPKLIADEPIADCFLENL